MSERYQGWTNWETWCCNLHLQNDYDSYQSITRMAGRMSCDYDDFDDAVFECGQELKALVEENLGSIENIPMMWKDMIDASFREINFNEISKHLIEEARIEMANN